MPLVTLSTGAPANESLETVRAALQCGAGAVQRERDSQGRGNNLELVQVGLSNSSGMGDELSFMYMEIASYVHVKALSGIYVV